MKNIHKSFYFKLPFTFYCHSKYLRKIFTNLSPLNSLIPFIAIPNIYEKYYNKSPPRNSFLPFIAILNTYEKYLKIPLLVIPFYLLLPFRIFTKNIYKSLSSHSLSPHCHSECVVGQAGLKWAAPHGQTWEIGIIFPANVVVVFFLIIFLHLFLCTNNSFIHSFLFHVNFYKTSILKYFMGISIFNISFQVWLWQYLQSRRALQYINIFI